MKKIDFGDRQWSAHAQDNWIEDALNPRWPGPLRVAFVAYGRHAANGHAYLKQGELAKLLPIGMGDDGLPITPTRQTLNRWINAAVEYGFLSQGSKLLCLVVPNHRVQGGRGSADAPCRRHPRGKSSRNRNVTPQRVTFEPKRHTVHETFQPKRHSPEGDVSGSGPLSSNTPSTPERDLHLVTDLVTRNGEVAS